MMRIKSYTLSKAILIIGIIVNIFVFISCQDNDPQLKHIDFIGDSIVAKWDVEETFPAYVVENVGIGGTGVEYLESLAGKEIGKVVVVLTGTNDMNAIKNDSAKIYEYCLRYSTALSNLKAEKLFVISILPREFRNEVSLLPTIEEVNSILERLVSQEPSMVFVNVYDKFLCADKLDYDLYEDNLHLTPQGYEILNSVIRELIR